MTQKLLRVGTSAAVTIPKGSLKELGLKIGDKVVVRVNQKQKMVTIQPDLGVDREVLDWTIKFIKRYRPALNALAKQ